MRPPVPFGVSLQWCSTVAKSAEPVTEGVFPPTRWDSLRPLCAQSPEARDLVTGLLCRWRRGNDWCTGRPGLFQAPIHDSNAGSGWQQPGQLKTEGIQQCRGPPVQPPRSDVAAGVGPAPQAWLSTGTIEAACYPEVGYDSCLVDPLQRATPEGAGFLLANPVAMGTTQKDEVYLRHVTSGRIAKGASRGLAKRVDRCQRKSL